jgi:glutamate dehydrogenase
MFALPRSSWQDYDKKLISAGGGVFPRSSKEITLSKEAQKAIGFENDPYLGRELGRYFPKILAEKFPDALEKHRLRREIIATQLANSMINRGGPSLVVRIADQTGATSGAIAAAFAAVRSAYDMPALNDEINALDNRIGGEVQLSLYQQVQDLLLDRLVWFLRNVDLTRGLANIVDHYKKGIDALANELDSALPSEALAERAARTA